jgi:polyisoprenoid-binding protein YceI
VARSLRLNGYFSAAIISALGILIAGSSQRLGAQASTVVLDPANTKVIFTLGATLHTVHGTFAVRRGEIRLDSITGETTGSIVVDATSAETGNSARDKKMHTDILESQKFREIVFTPKQVKGRIELQGTSQVEVLGTFRLHGQEHELSVPVSIQEGANGKFKAEAHFAVPYVQWGLKNPSTFVLHVSDTVQLEIQAEGQMAEQNRPGP